MLDTKYKLQRLITRYFLFSKNKLVGSLVLFYFFFSVLAFLHSKNPLIRQLFVFLTIIFIEKKLESLSIEKFKNLDSFVRFDIDFFTFKNFFFRSDPESDP